MQFHFSFSPIYCYYDYNYYYFYCFISYFNSSNFILSIFRSQWRVSRSNTHSEFSLNVYVTAWVLNILHILGVGDGFSYSTTNESYSQYAYSFKVIHVYAIQFQFQFDIRANGMHLEFDHNLMLNFILFFFHFSISFRSHEPFQKWQSNRKIPHINSQIQIYFVSFLR